MVEGGEGNDQLWGSGRGDCWVPLQGPNPCFISSFYIQGHKFHPDTQENNNELCHELLADTTLFSTLITQKLVFAIWGLCWYSCFFMFCCSLKRLNFTCETHINRPRGPNHVVFRCRNASIASWEAKFLVPKQKMKVMVSDLESLSHRWNRFKNRNR